MLNIYNTIVGIGIIAIIAVIVLVLAILFLGETDKKVFQFLKKHAALIAFLLALGGTIGSLIYSEGFHFAPCEFCWWQRIFLYPQVIVLGTLLWKKIREMWTTTIILSIIGICFSIYHVFFIQTGIVGDAACVAAGTSCSKIDVLIFGWITIPIMCLTLFAGILAFAFVAHKKEKVS